MADYFGYIDFNLKKMIMTTHNISDKYHKNGSDNAIC